VETKNFSRVKVKQVFIDKRVTVFLDLSKSRRTSNLKSGSSFNRSWFFVLLSMIHPRDIATCYRKIKIFNVSTKHEFPLSISKKKTTEDLLLYVTMKIIHGHNYVVI
jgi:hypothetical protein